MACLSPDASDEIFGPIEPSVALEFRVSGMQSILNQLGAGRLLMIGAVGALSLGLLGWFVLGMGKPPLALLFSGLDQRNSAEIIEQLRQEGVKYETQAGGSIIYVEEKDALRLRMKLATDGYETGSVVGYEIFDNQSALGTTSFVQNINHLRALEGELSRTIGAIDSIAAARVHLNIPKREVFSREDQPASASVVIKARRGQVDGRTVKAIQHLIASAVPGLAPQNISIADDSGALLADGAGSRNPDGSTSAGSIEERTIAFQERLRQQVQEMVSGIVGPGRSRVQVAAEVDFSRVVEESEVYDPEGQVVRRVDTYERSQSAVDREAEKGVTVGNQLPDAGFTNQTSASEPKSTSADNEVKETTSYEISKTKRTAVNEAGGVKRLSVAVVVDGTYATDANGQRAYTPRSTDELDQIRRLVERTIGYDDKRGDRIEVVNLQFANDGPLDMTDEKPGLFAFTTAQIFQIAQTAVMGLVIILLALFVIRPILNALMKQASSVPAGMPQLAGAGASAGSAGALGAPGAPQLAAPGEMAALPAPEGISGQIDVAKIQGKVQESSIRKIGEIVTSHPDESLAILRNWLHESE